MGLESLDPRGPSGPPPVPLVVGARSAGTRSRRGFSGRVPFLSLLLASLLWWPFPVSAQGRASGLAASLRPRSIGPVKAGGPISAVVVDPNDPARIFVAGAGGVWRSRDAGTTWTPVFDEAPVQAVGDVALSVVDPDVLWAGTGSLAAEGLSQEGRGVFRSEDGGREWAPAGLQESGRVSRILTASGSRDEAWVATEGPAWNAGGERGVFHTMDGGESWTPVLRTAPGSGAVDLAGTPSDPGLLLAAVRPTLADSSVGDGSRPGALPVRGIFRSEDGGASWSRADQGVPTDADGVAVALALSEPRVGYAVVRRSGAGELLRTEDGGRSWSFVRALGRGARDGRRWALHVDPARPERVYVLGRALRVSDDGGRTFRRPEPGLPPGVHALDVDPDRPDRLWAGTTRGVFVSGGGGAHWRYVQGPSLAIVTGVDVDLSVPFRVFAAVEGAGPWRGPSDGWRTDAAGGASWSRVGGADARSVLVDPEDPEITFSAARGPRMLRFDARTLEAADVTPWAPHDARLRSAVRPPLVSDPFRPRLVYAGSQYVHRSPDRGHTWQLISSDMSGEGPSGEDAITALATSPVEEEVLWVGTGDGRLEMTRSSGGTWTDLSPRLPRSARNGGRISWVEASRHHGGTAFLAVDRHRSGDRRPYLYRTGDYGRSWNRLGRDGGLEGIVEVVEQDPVVPSLLFAGTTRGLFLSLDGGGSWSRWAGPVPSVPVTALTVHPRDYDLVVGTAGRGVWVVDDVRPLRALARDPRGAGEPVVLFDPPPAYLRHRGGPRTPRRSGDGPAGEDRPYGALLTYRVGPEAGAPVRLEVVDDTGAVVRTLAVPGSPGFHRVAWDLGTDPEALARPGEDADRLPPLPVLPGPYTVRLRAGNQDAERALRVLPDPSSDLTMEDRRAKHRDLLAAAGSMDALREAGRHLSTIDSAAVRARGEIRRLGVVRGDSIAAALSRLTDRAGALEAELHRPPDPDSLLRSLSSSFGAPTESQGIALHELEDRVSATVREVNDFLLGRVGLLNDRLREAGVAPLPELGEVRPGQGHLSAAP